MESILGCLNWLYNQALESRKTAYEQRKQSLSFYDQCKWLTQLRTANEHQLGEIAIGASRGMLKRLDLAFQAFFRRVRAGKAPGFPRFRPISRCRTIDVADPHNGMVRLHKGCYLIRLKGFPRLRVRRARPLPLDAPLKSVRLTQRGHRWEASLVYVVDKQPLAPSVAAVGIDMGIRKRVAALQRFDRKQYIRERNACHRATTGIIRQHGLIAVEALKVTNMTRSARGTADQPGSNVKAKAGLNREVLAQNWSLLQSQFRYKAEWAGREYVEVDPKHTSQDCSRCSARNDPGRSETYRCRACGLVADRDVNAATNILAAGVLAAGASTWAVRPCVAPEPYARAA